MPKKRDQIKYCPTCAHQLTISENHRIKIAIGQRRYRERVQKEKELLEQQLKELEEKKEQKQNKPTPLGQFYGGDTNGLLIL